MKVDCVHHGPDQEGAPVGDPKDLRFTCGPCLEDAMKDLPAAIAVRMGLYAVGEEGKGED